MNYARGQILSHPHHGPATVTKVATRNIRNRRERYLILDVHHSDLSIAVPVERAEEIGVRPVLAVDALHGIFDILTGPTGEKDSVWSRRMKNNTERLRSGDIATIAGLIRDLTRWNTDRRLSFGEMTLLRDASQPFLAELALVLSMTEDDAAGMVDAAILEGTMPALGEKELAAAS